MSDVMYVPDIARALGRTEAAIRAAFRRRSESVPHEHAFRIGRQIAVRRQAFRLWLRAKERGHGR